MSSGGDTKRPGDSVKSYCYRSECRAVVTGFQWSEWKVCSTCKCEVTDHLYKLIKERKSESEAPSKEEKDDEPFNPWYIV